MAERRDQLCLPGAGLPPGCLRDKGEDLFESFRQTAKAAGISMARVPADVCIRVFAVSEFVAMAASRDPAMFLSLLGSADMDRGCTEGHYREKLGESVRSAPDEEALMKVLRRFRTRAMTRIAWRDLTGRATLAETMEDLSSLARAVLDESLLFLQERLALELGTPCNAEGEPQSLVVIGMGKLGARELNFSSDIDLIFSFPEPGETRGGLRSVSNDEFFDRLARRLVKVIGATTEDGFVFRVDARLRPFGDSGPLVLDFDALLDYYETHGREWERYAWIKADVVAGDIGGGELLLDAVRPFVYRRSLDFGVFDEIRDMKRLISEETKKRGLSGNIKTGPGGIREIEFIGQTFQLLRGGRDPELRVRGILPVLHSLERLGYVSGDACRELADAYGFLRVTEHRLQEYADRQTQDLPVDETARLALAFSMGYPEWPALAEDLEGHRSRVNTHFRDLVSQEGEKGGRGEDEGVFPGIWQGVSREAAREGLSAYGFEDPEKVIGILDDLRASPSLRSASATARSRVDRLMPALLAEAARTERPAECVLRLAGLVEVIARRSVYVSLLLENREALERLVAFCAESPWIGTQLIRFPVLIDEFLDPGMLASPPTLESLRNELEKRMDSIPAGDEELVMDELRFFKLGNVFRVAVADLAGSTPLMRVSDYLTHIAEVVIKKVCDLAWDHLVSRHGRPLCLVPGMPCERGFLVVAYGKLGGIELGYGSDLDLVFIHSGAQGRVTDGPRPMDCNLFYARLCQRILHILTVSTPAGVLYSVDMRLRPSGEAGLLVSHMDAFAEYQRNEAWTWEHQALVRARPVAGDAGMASWFSALREEILMRERDRARLGAEVRQMRKRMREGRRGVHEPGLFDLKQDQGGIIDIEFIAQFLVLAWAHRHPELARWTDTVRILETVGATGVLPEQDGIFLRDSYLAFRGEVHRASLREERAVVPEDRFTGVREGVRRIWREVLGG